MSGKVFEGFEKVSLPEGVREIVYGVNVLQEQSSVKTTDSGTVAELVDKYRKMLNLPPDVQVFVDGVKFAPSDYIPATARRIEIVKPAGQKGNGEIPKIELADKDAAQIVVAREDTVEYVLRTPVVEGKVSKSLEPRLAVMDLQVLAHGREYLTVGHYDSAVKATRKSLSPLAQIARRVTGGIAVTGSVTINTVIMGIGETPLRIELNGAVLPNGQCRKLEAGDKLLVVLPGETREADFEAWATEQRQLASAAFLAAEDEREEKVAARATELTQMDWARLRIEAAHKGVKLTSLGRGRAEIEADILRAEFPELPPEEEFVRNWLEENAPEILEA